MFVKKNSLRTDEEVPLLMQFLQHPSLSLRLRAPHLCIRAAAQLVKQTDSCVTAPVVKIIMVHLWSVCSVLEKLRE